MAKSTLITLLFVTAVAAQSKLWEQCGGIYWVAQGGATTCVAPYVCVYSSAYYSQCLVGTGVSSAAPTSSKATTSIQSTLDTSTKTTSTSTSTPITPPSSSTSTATTPSSSNCPSLPASLTLTSNAKLPDPFTTFSGTKITTLAAFKCRQAEISALFQKYELGTLPGPPTTLTATLSGNTLTIGCSNGGASISFAVTITYPTTGTAPFPAIIGYGGGSIPAPAGVAMINFNNDDMAAQVSTASRGVGKFYTLHGSSATASAMTAWAWGVSRIIDALEKTPTARINTARIGVTGCSRNGKGAMVAGALEPRIALTIPQESGAGGSACWRVSDYLKAGGANIQTASEIITEDPWFSTAFNSYVNSVPTLPFDHHLLAAMIAPRALLVIDNNIDWLGPASCWNCMKAASAAWTAMGVADRIGYTQIGTHSHCAFPSNQQAALTAFVGRFLLGQSVATSVMVSDFAYDQARWVDWSIPTLV